MKFIKIVLAIMSLVCLLDLPYGYYQLYRFTAMGVFLTLAFKERDSENWMIFWTLSALLVQPFFKIALRKTIWNLIDLFWAVILIYSIFINQNKTRDGKKHSGHAIVNQSKHNPKSMNQKTYQTAINNLPICATIQFTQFETI